MSRSTLRRFRVPLALAGALALRERRCSPALAVLRPTRRGPEAAEPRLTMGAPEAQAPGQETKAEVPIAPVQAGASRASADGAAQVALGTAVEALPVKVARVTARLPKSVLVRCRAATACPAEGCATATSAFASTTRGRRSPAGARLTSSAAHSRAARAASRRPIRARVTAARRNAHEVRGLGLPGAATRLHIARDRFNACAVHCRQAARPLTAPARPSNP